LKKLAVLSFAFVTIEIDHKISLEVFGGSGGHDFFKRLSFISFPASYFLCKSRCTEDVAQLSQTSSCPLAFILAPHIILSSASLDQPASISHYSECC
jgi:hypothetical protein